MRMRTEVEHAVRVDTKYVTNCDRCDKLGQLTW